MNELNRAHLFLSCAIEDKYLSEWLARKLSAEGYVIWMDDLKILAGEKWPQTIQQAIKERFFRMVAVISENSIDKENPLKERDEALAIEKNEGIDFLIPLKLDDCNLDLRVRTLNYVPFNRSWAEVSHRQSGLFDLK